MTDTPDAMKLLLEAAAIGEATARFEAAKELSAKILDAIEGIKFPQENLPDSSFMVLTAILMAAGVTIRLGGGEDEEKAMKRVEAMAPSALAYGYNAAPEILADCLFYRRE